MKRDFDLAVAIDIGQGQIARPRGQLQLPRQMRGVVAVADRVERLFDRKEKFIPAIAVDVRGVNRSAHIARAAAIAIFSAPVAASRQRRPSPFSQPVMPNSKRPSPSTSPPPRPAPCRLHRRGTRVRWRLGVVSPWW